MKTIELKAYSFNELNERAQQVVIEKERYTTVKYNNWWEWVYEDAKMIGINIAGFDLDHRHISLGYLKDNTIFICEKILKNWGEKTEGYKIADNFKKQYRNASGDEVIELENEFHSLMMGVYLNLLKKEYDYLTSDQAIKEELNSLGVWKWFDENGNDISQFVKE